MGQVYQYHITMLVTDEQVDAVRTLFKDKNWPCWLKVLTDEDVAGMVQGGFTDLFPVMTAGQDGGIGHSIFTEIKSEIVDVDEESNSSDKLGDLPSKTEPPEISEDENTMDYDMMCSKDSSSDYGKNSNVNNETSKKRRQASTKGNVDEIETGASSKLKCPLCEVTCVTKTILKRHFKRQHKGTWLDIECADCQKRFKTKEEMWQHRREVNHDPPKDVNKTVKLDLLLPEERIKLGHLKCEICANFYPHKRSLRRHMNKVHKDLLPKWNCPICDAEFETRDELWKHKRELGHKTNIWSLGNYQCDSCGKIYTRYDSFQEHQISCEKTESEKLASLKHPCDICGLLFKSVLRVKSHKRGVHTVAPVVCHVCGAMCKNKRALLVHRRRHDMKNKKYICDDCGKSFFNSTLLAQHVRTHTKEKPYKCPMCNYTCAIKQNIHKHSMKVHKTQCKAVCVDELKDAVREKSNETLLQPQWEKLQNKPLHDRQYSESMVDDKGHISQLEHTFSSEAKMIENLQDKHSQSEFHSEKMTANSSENQQFRNSFSHETMVANNEQNKYSRRSYNPESMVTDNGHCKTSRSPYSSEMMVADDGQNLNDYQKVLDYSLNTHSLPPGGFQHQYQ